MSKGRFLTITEQVALHLRGEIARSRWQDTLPGLRQLAGDLEVNFKTVTAALTLLEEEGVLTSQGPGRNRRITGTPGTPPSSLRIAILQFEPLHQLPGYHIELERLLIEAGFQPFFIEKSSLELEMNVTRVKRLLAATEADAWVVVAGSRQLLEWFTTLDIPVLALFGRRRGLPIASAGPEKKPAFQTATRTLVAVGHRRIVLLTRRTRRLPFPGLVEQGFLDELNLLGIQSGLYNIPDWEETPEGFHTCLQSLFAVTPPTALIIDEACFFFSAQQFLMNQGLRVPDDVSLVCTDSHSAFEWLLPSVAHIQWDIPLVLRRVLEWAENTRQGKEDKKQRFTAAEFIDGGTIGPSKQLMK